MAEESIEKSVSTPKTITTRPPTKEIGQPRIVTSSRYIDDMKKADLKRLDTRICLYNNMLYDDAVSRSVGATNEQVLAALHGGEVKPKKSSRSKVAADFLNYCFRNMSYGTWLEVMNSACTDLINGVSLQNIVVEKSKSGKYKGTYTLKTLMPYDPKSIYGWVWDKENRYLKGFVQKPLIRKLRDPNLKDFNGNIDYSSIGGGVYEDSKYPFIATEQMLHFRHNPKFGNPEGDSPLNHCYDAWVEKKLVEHYEIVG